MSDQNSVGEGYREARHDGIDCLNPRIQIQKQTTGEWVDRQATGALFLDFRYRVPVEPEPEWRDLIEGEIVAETDECQPVPDGPWYVWDTSQAPAIGKPYNRAYHWPRRRKVSKPEPVPVVDPDCGWRMLLNGEWHEEGDEYDPTNCLHMEQEWPKIPASFVGTPYHQRRFYDARRRVKPEPVASTVDTVPPLESNTDAVKVPWAKQTVSWSADLDPSDPRYKALTNDPVHIPAHYTQGPIECVDWVRLALTDEEYRGWLKGDALAYIFRERLKGGDQDLDKASRYLTFHNRPKVTPSTP